MRKEGCDRRARKLGRQVCLAGLCLVAALLPVQAAGAAPYRLKTETLLPAMPAGDFDQLAADLGRNRLYVSAEDGGTMYVFDLRSGALVASGGAVASPHKVAVDPRSGRLFVADGDGSVKILDTKLQLIARIAVGPKADTGLFDRQRRIFYVSSRDPAAPDTRSIIWAISADRMTILHRYAVPATTLKGMILDRAGQRLFVSLRDKNAIGIVHLDSGDVQSWTPKDLHMNVPLAFDSVSRTILAGSRKPGELDVFDATDGHLLSKLPSTETSDSMSFDRAGRTLYLSGDSGMSRYHIGPAGDVRLLETDAALVGKSSLYVPELHTLYVMRPKLGDRPAALTMFDVAM